MIPFTATDARRLTNASTPCVPAEMIEPAIERINDLIADAAKSGASDVCIQPELKKVAPFARQSILRHFTSNGYRLSVAFNDAAWLFW